MISRGCVVKEKRICTASQARRPSQPDQAAWRPGASGGREARGAEGREKTRNAGEKGGRLRRVVAGYRTRASLPTASASTFLDGAQASDLLGHLVVHPAGGLAAPQLKRLAELFSTEMDPDGIFSSVIIWLLPTEKFRENMRFSDGI